MKESLKINERLLIEKILDAVNDCIKKNDQFEMEGYDYIDDGCFMINLDKDEYKLLQNLIQ